MPNALRSMFGAASVALAGGVVATAWWVDVRAAALLLSGALLAGGVLRATLPERAVPTGRGRGFDVGVLLLLALVAALLAPWGLATAPS
jgi:hypothetical protein